MMRPSLAGATAGATLRGAGSIAVRSPHRLAVALAACVVVAACGRAGQAPASAAGSGIPLAAGDHPYTLVADGVARTYLLHVPPIGGSGPRPLVIELHGGGGQAEGMERLTHLTASTDPRGWLVVAPDGVGHQWNDGRPGVGSDVDDVAFIRALIDGVAARTPVDTTRVFATGISNGAMMTGRLACEMADRFAAVAQVDGTLGEDVADRCAPARPVSLLLIAGTADPLVPYGGGEVGAGLGLSRGVVVGAEPYLHDWLVRDRLAGTSPSIDQLAPDTTVTTYSGGGARAPRVAFYRVEGAGHTWPGGAQYLPAFVIGSTSRTFSASEVIVDFFASVTAGS